MYFYFKSNDELIMSMIKSGVLHTDNVIEAFRIVDRKYFVPEELSEHLYEDRPLPIGKNQTISQPSTVAFMLELLEVKEGDCILDVGSGSGWTTGLLGSLVGKSGRVEGLERVDELVEVGKNNIAKLNMPHVSIQKASDKLGIPDKTFDAILVSAAAEEIPKELFEQLNMGANLVIPIRNSIFKFKKTPQGIESREYTGFAFVPLIY